VVALARHHNQWYSSRVDPAQAIADSTRQDPDRTPAAEVAAWLHHPEAEATQPPSQLDLLLAEIERGEYWEANGPDGKPGRWMGKGPEPPKETAMDCEARSVLNQRYEDSRRELEHANYAQDLPETAHRAMLDRQREHTPNPATTPTPDPVSTW
jgi:hypothetical protein